MRPQEGLLKVAVHPPRKEDSALNISVIVKLVTTGRTANSFVTTNERSLFGRMRPVHGTLDVCDQSAARRSLSYETVKTMDCNLISGVSCYVLDLKNLNTSTCGFGVKMSIYSLHCSK